MRGFFTAIVSKAQAAKIMKDSSYGFFFGATPQIAAGILLSQQSRIIDGITCAILAAALLIWKSRIAAVLLAILMGTGIGIIIMNLATQSTESGRNIWILVIFFVIAIRATQASFLFHGKFANDVEGEGEGEGGGRGGDRHPLDPQ